MKKFIYLFFICFLSVSVYSQKTLTDSIHAIQMDNKLNSHEKAAKIELIMSNSGIDTDEKISIYYNILLPQIKKINPKEEYNEEMAKAYRRLSSLYYYKEDIASSKLALDTAIVHAERINNDTILADIYRRYATWHIYSGSVEEAHKYFYKAINLYEKLKDDAEVSSAFFAIANTHVQMRDYAEIKNIILRLQELSRDDVSMTFLYNTYQIQSAYYHLLYEAFPEEKTYRDSTILYMKKGLDLAENYKDQLSERVDIAWNYYNLTVVYSNDYDPPLVDSISYYLNKIENLDFSNVDENDKREIFISVNDTKAWLHYYRKEYDEAEKKMLEVLDLLKQQIDPNMVIPEYSEAYSFLAMLYEETGKPSLALKYQKLFNENQSERFGQEKMYALKELNTKYEVEKKENHIAELKREHEYTQRIFLLSLIILAALLSVIVLLIIAFRLKRKSMEQKLYEAALIAEQRLVELEHQGKEKSKLQEQYDKLQEMAASSKDNSQYEKELDSLKQKIQQKDSRTITGKVEKIVESSALDVATKQKYLKLLADANTEKLEQTFGYSLERLTPMDMKYIVCFSIGMDISHIAAIFNVEQASVYTVRYRIKKKFKSDILLDFLI